MLPYEVNSKSYHRHSKKSDDNSHRMASPFDHATRCINAGRVKKLDIALASLPQGVHPDPAAERHLLQLLKDLPPDRAWWVSHLVVRYQDVQFQRSQLPPSECHLDQSIDSIPIPDSILRAVARLQAHHAECEK
jgi:hypothetical protein